MDSYKDSMDIELFLVRVLNLKPGSKSAETLKGFYEALYNYENGHPYMYGRAKHQVKIKQMLKFFDRAIDKLAKKNPRVYSLKHRLEHIDSADGILDLYNDLKSYEF